jgi:hypothetical protein
MSWMEVSWECQGPDPHWCERLLAVLPAVGQALDLATDFQAILICADAAPQEEACWFRFQPPASDQTGSRSRLEVYCSAASFAKPEPARSTVYPSRQVWDPHEGAWSGQGFDPEGFSITWAEIFLYHNLLLARDLARGEISLDTIPAGQVEAFEAAWQVVIDGRLSRAGLPGYSLADRRGRFSRLFSSAGVLMPDHWQIFQSLWDGGLSAGRDVLAVIRQLPRR